MVILPNTDWRAVINETESPYHAYNGVGKWNAYDIVFRAARFKDGKLTEKAMVTLYFNGKKVHTNQIINQVWGGPNSGIDGGNDGGKGITDTPGGLKLQAEGHDVFYRNVWIKDLELKERQIPTFKPCLRWQLTADQRINRVEVPRKSIPAQLLF